MDPGEAARLAAKVHGTDFSKVPQFLDISPEAITAQAHAVNSNCTYLGVSYLLWLNPIRWARQGR